MYNTYVQVLYTLYEHRRIYANYKLHKNVYNGMYYVCIIQQYSKQQQWRHPRHKGAERAFDLYVDTSNQLSYVVEQYQ